ncbi:hypothetical protein ACTG15_06170 [Aeromonas sp. 164P]
MAQPALLIWCDLIGPYQEYNTQELILSLIRRVKDDEGQLLASPTVDMSFDSLQQRTRRHMSSYQAATLITLRDTDQLVVGSNINMLATNTIKQARRARGPS